MAKASFLVTIVFFLLLDQLPSNKPDSKHHSHKSHIVCSLFLRRSSWTCARCLRHTVGSSVMFRICCFFSFRIYEVAKRKLPFLNLTEAATVSYRVSSSLHCDIICDNKEAVIKREREWVARDCDPFPIEQTPSLKVKAVKSIQNKSCDSDGYHKFICKQFFLSRDGMGYLVFADCFMFVSSIVWTQFFFIYWFVAKFERAI